MWKIDTNTNTSIVIFIVYIHTHTYVQNMFSIMELLEETRGEENEEENDTV
jgi:hypothetical protein